MRINRSRQVHNYESANFSGLALNLQKITNRQKVHVRIEKHPAFVEKRKCRRYPLPEGLLFLHTPITGRKLGALLDISLDGLAWSSVENGDPAPEEGSFDIMMDDSEFCITGIPYRKISATLPNHGPRPTDPVLRCGAEFLRLNREQILQLFTFIRSYEDV